MTIAEAEYRVKILLEEYKLFDWKFKWTSSRRYFGMCSHTKKQIGLSKPFVLKNSEHQIMDTILHELAHALVGPHQGHNRVWKEMATHLGANPIATYDQNNTTVPYRYELTCTKCKHKTYKNKLNKTHKYYHKLCYNSITKEGLYKLKTL